MDKLITGIVVTYNTKEIFERCYKAFRKAHPEMKLIIVDGSSEGNPCKEYVSSLNNTYTKVFQFNENIGHGRGLHFALKKVETPFALIMDSDTEILKSPIKKMLNMMEDDTLGVGNIEKTAFDGYEWGCKPSHKNQGWMRYLHPFFCLIQLKEYWRYRPYCHHGAPAVNMCLDVHRRGLGEKIIKEFPIWHTDGKGWVWEGKPNKYVRHDTQGTRANNRINKRPEIEGTWDKVIDDGNNPQKRITVITCTGDRPQAFSLCKLWIEKQTLQPTQWIIVDDGKQPLDTIDNPIVHYIRREPTTEDPKHTMLLNLKIALEKVGGDYIFFMEDDEYYSSDFLEKMMSKFKDYLVIGIGRSKYYHLPSKRYGIHDNMGHASLAQTAIKREFLEKVKMLLNGDSFLDIRIWQLFNGAKAGHLTVSKNVFEIETKDKRGFLFDDKNDPLYVGMKGLPGRTGIGAGHNGTIHWYHNDINFLILKQWIKNKDDFEIYYRFTPNTKVDFRQINGKTTYKVTIPKKGFDNKNRPKGSRIRGIRGSINRRQIWQQ